MGCTCFVCSQIIRDNDNKMQDDYGVNYGVHAGCFDALKDAFLKESKAKWANRYLNTIIGWFTCLWKR